MKKESPTTYKVGSISAFAEWTKSVVREPERACGAPKKWFDSEETAGRTLRAPLRMSEIIIGSVPDFPRMLTFQQETIDTGAAKSLTDAKERLTLAA